MSKVIYMFDEKDARLEFNDAVSCAYEGSDWCEDGSIRQDIADLKSQVISADDEVDGLNASCEDFSRQLYDLDELTLSLYNKIETLEKAMSLATSSLLTLEKMVSTQALKNNLTALHVRWVDKSDDNSNAFDIK